MKATLLVACSQGLVEVRGGGDEMFSKEEGRALERKAKSLSNPSPSSAAIVGYNLRGPSWLGQRKGGTKISVKKGVI